VVSARDNENEVERARISGIDADLEVLQVALGFHFSNTELLVQALTHRSFANERQSDGCRDNETLEFLGDAVLDLVIGHHLMTGFPGLGEGDLSTTRAQMVSEQGLYRVARDLDLGQWLRLGKGEERSGGRDKSSILADALEALLAAVYLDGGFDAARDVVLKHFSAHTPKTPGQHADYKTRLQELAQRLYKTAPVYEILSEEGPDHQKTFLVSVAIAGNESARARGHSKKAAEQAAAALALDSLGA